MKPKVFDGLLSLRAGLLFKQYDGTPVGVGIRNGIKALRRFERFISPLIAQMSFQRYYSQTFISVNEVQIIEIVERHKSGDWLCLVPMKIEYQLRLIP